MITRELQKAASPFIRQAINHPFNEALRKGTLPKPIFEQFLRQDKLYLRKLSQILSQISKRLYDPYHQKLFSSLSRYINRSEMKLLNSYLNLNSAVKSTTSDYCTDYSSVFDVFLSHRMGDTPSIKKHQKRLNNHNISHSRYDSTAEFRLKENPCARFFSDKGFSRFAAQAYIDFLHQTLANECVEVSIASTMPCFYLYSEVGLAMRQRGIAHDNPYRSWIWSYSSTSFLSYNHRLIEIVNELANYQTPTIHAKMMDVFLNGVAHELKFWDHFVISQEHNPENCCHL